MTNKEKLLASAQKHLKKKLLPRAIKDFAKVVEIDPNDMRSRQKLAELYSRTGKSSEAFEQYETVAKCFAGNGFYLKAIAIYRQMQKLDPSQISIYARLAELNEKQGLIGNALAEYRQLVSHYEKNELTADAVRILEKMQGLDPENLNIRIKLAEVLTANGQVAEGREHFDASLKVLSDKQDFDRALKLYKKFLPLFPNDNAIQQGLAAVLLARGEHQKGFSLLQNLLRKTPDDPEILRMLAAAYRDAGDLNNSRLTYQHLLKLDASDLGLRESLVRCCLDGRHYEQALAELEEWKEAFQQAGRLETLKEFYEDLKQVLPDNRAVLQTLDSIYELTGDGDKLLDFMSSSSSADAYAVEEETVSDSLLDTAADDMEEDQILDLDEIEIPLGDGAAETGAEPADAGDETAEPEENVLELDISTALQLEAVEEDSLDLNFDFGEDAAEPPPGRDLQSELEEAEFYLQQGLFDEAERVCRELLAENPASEEGRRKLDDILLRRGGKEAERDASSELHDLAVEVLEEGFPELALDSLDNILGDEFAELDDLLDLSSAGPVFRTDVDDQIAADDMESHYNLGIAYREMGLFEDAIIEFGKAEADPARFVDCKTLKGLCYAARGEFEKSEASYMDALVSTSIDEGQRLSLQYELGMLYEAFQRPADALDSYKSVAGVDPQFRDVEEKIAALSASGGTPASSGSSKDRISFL